MPKIVDHDRRRRQIIDATMRVIRRIGVEAATVREIAREVGFSSGVLAHYFENKKQILVMTHLAAFEDTRARIDAIAKGRPSIDTLRLALHEALPLDEQRLLEAHVDVSFWGQAILDPELQRVRTESHRQSLERWQRMIAALRAEGIVQCAESDADLAGEIVILVDAVSVQALLHPDVMNAARQRHVVENFLRRIQRDA
jgi:AcrR family transcriptional regulator